MVGDDAFGSSLTFRSKLGSTRPPAAKVRNGYHMQATNMSSRLHSSPVCGSTEKGRPAATGAALPAAGGLPLATTAAGSGAAAGGAAGAAPSRAGVPGVPRFFACDDMAVAREGGAAGGGDGSGGNVVAALCGDCGLDGLSPGRLLVTREVPQVVRWWRSEG